MLRFVGVAIRAGDLLCGKYLLDATIGRGGMGEVFSAQIVQTDFATPHLIPGMKVAVKVVNRTICDDLLMARLYREADAARRIHSDYVPTLLAVETTKDEDGKDELFIAMQLLQGQSFSQRLKSRGGYLSWEEVHAMGEGVLLGLIDAHAAGIVHRDLKPGNIFLAQQPEGDERAMILDFGVCKLDGNDGDKLTVTGESLGTVSYMAPEQIRGASKVDERADLYSFAMVVFEALSGRLAHDASGQMAMLASKLERSARSLKDLATVPIPASLDGVIGKCLARKPSDRYSSAQELLKIWRGLGKASVQPRQASMPSSPSIYPATQTALTANALDTEEAHGTARTGLMIVAGSVVAAISVVTFIVVHASSAASDARNTSANANVAAANANANANANIGADDSKTIAPAATTSTTGTTGTTGTSNLMAIPPPLPVVAASATAASASATATAMGAPDSITIAPAPGSSPPVQRPWRPTVRPQPAGPSTASTGNGTGKKPKAKIDTEFPE